MSYRYLLALALAAGIASEASAQFTTFIPPQNKAPCNNGPSLTVFSAFSSRT